MQFPNGFFYIKSRANGKVLDIEGPSGRVGVSVSLCHVKTIHSNDNQLWFHENGYLVNKKSNLCLTAADGDAATKQDRRQLGTDAANQRWNYQDGHLRIQDTDQALTCETGKDDAAVYTRHDRPDDSRTLWDLVPQQ